MTLTALDSETMLILPGMLAPPLVCVSWAREGEAGVFHHSDPGLLDFLLGCFQGDTTFANAPFDLAVFIEAFPALMGPIFDALDGDRVHDVQTREKLLDLARGTFRFEEDEDGKLRAKGYSLFDVAKRRLGRFLDKDTWRMRYHDLWDVPLAEWPKGARDYAADDAIATLEIHQAQESLSKYLDNSTAQTRAHWALHLMSCWGFRTNAEAVEELDKRVRGDIAEIKEDLIQAGLVRADGSRNTKAAVARMVEVMGPDCVLTKKGLEKVKAMEMTPAQIIAEAPKTGKFVSVSMDSTVLSGDETLMAYSRYTQLRNLLTGSVKHLRTGTITPVQTRFEVLMETGRTSSSGPNIQNLRRAPGVRECFVPRDGSVIIACDYSAAELHTLAQVNYDLFGRSALGDALNKGIDVHLWVGAFLMGVDYEDAVKLLKAEDPHAKEMRQLAKAANFGFPGGCSAKRFVGIAHAYGVKIEVRQAAKLKALWFRAWPEMRLYFDHVGECVDGNGWHFVKQARVDRLRSRCTYTSACNSYFQGLAADGAKAAAYAVAREQHLRNTVQVSDGVWADSPLFGTKSLAFVHDEILIEAPESRAHEAAMRLQRVMEREFNAFVPECPTEAEPTIMRFWSKKAKQVWTDDGRLMPWNGEEKKPTPTQWEMEGLGAQ